MSCLHSMPFLSHLSPFTYLLNRSTLPPSSFGFYWSMSDTQLQWGVTMFSIFIIYLSSACLFLYVCPPFTRECDRLVYIFRKPKKIQQKVLKQNQMCNSLSGPNNSMKNYFPLPFSAAHTIWEGKLNYSKKKIKSCHSVWTA